MKGGRQEIVKSDKRRKVEKHNLKEALGSYGPAQKLKGSPYQSPVSINKIRIGDSSLKSERSKLNFSKNDSKKSVKAPADVSEAKKVVKRENKKGKKLEILSSPKDKGKSLRAGTMFKHLLFDSSNQNEYNQIILTPRSSMSSASDESLMISGNLIVIDNVQFRSNSSFGVTQPKNSYLSGDNGNQLFTEELFKKLSLLSRNE